MKVDYSDMVSKGAFTFFVIRFLRTYYETQIRYPQEDKILKNGWLIVVPVYILASLPGFNFIEEWYYQIFILLISVFIYKTRYMRSSRMLFNAVLPVLFMIVVDGLAQLLVPNFYEENNSYFGSAYGFAFFWMIGFGIYLQKQNKVEIEQRKKTEQERIRSEAKKQELEYQVAERTAELTKQKHELEEIISKLKLTQEQLIQSEKTASTRAVALTKQKEKLEETISELKSTQNQLIQAEKMASLGELTAGIAHEIQNPLNFVNNFSELSVELAKELEEEFERENLDKDLIVELIGDLVQNQEKINHHGKRAASIVRGMLQHSRTSTGQKEKVDLNDLADEYLRLSYHGLRAKDKTFNADFKTEFDAQVPKVDLVPQDFGRVLLNLINNAFYAVQQKSRMNIEGYKPLVIVKTTLAQEEILISVIDNGTGIPESVKNKIFQPFFTTKPTGQGTGLGLSLAYDIVTKGHGGKLEVHSKEGEGTEFVITLPV
ncbi:ATP-binding protein [Emticicia sp. 17c]|uniref:ATP-binding protein n=1 Tax=Emticicia sp. 17c TaxID=3127704 RepID=UPI00301CF09B